MDGIITKHLRNYLQPFEDPLHLYRHWWNPLMEEKELLQECRIRSNVLGVRKKYFSFHATKDTLKHGKEKRDNKDTICMNDKDTHISWMFTLKKRLPEACAYSRMDHKQKKQSTAAILPLELFSQFVELRLAAFASESLDQSSLWRWRAKQKQMRTSSLV